MKYGLASALLGLFLLIAVGCGKGLGPNADRAELFTVIYEIDPDFLTVEDEDPSNAGDDPFKGRMTAREIMIEEGITFPEGAMILHGLSVAGVGLRNTQANHELWQEYLDRHLTGRWRIHQAPPSEPIANKGRQATASPSPAP